MLCLCRSGQAQRSSPTWPDRRIIGTVYLSSASTGNAALPAGFPGNPRRWFNDSGLNLASLAGLHAFQVRLLAKAAEAVINLRRMNAQGVIVWDIEGEQYPQKTSYVCSPDQIATTAPEMESIVGPDLPYAGLRLDDAYFRTFRDAGFRVGVCVRPQHFQRNADGTAQQQFLSVSAVAAELIRKMRYAHDRWGATLFYLDSTVRPFGLPLPTDVLAEAAKAVPDSLLIPERTWPSAYAVSAPLRSFLFHADLGVPAVDRFLYPQSFAVDLINDADPATLAAHHEQLLKAAQQGDILLLHAGYWHPNNSAAMQILAEAGRH